MLILLFQKDFHNYPLILHYVYHYDYLVIKVLTIFFLSPLLIFIILKLIFKVKFIFLLIIIKVIFVILPFFELKLLIIMFNH